jgi:hypothetical protein
MPFITQIWLAGRRISATRGFQCHILTGGGGGATDRCVHNRPYKAFRVSIAT